MIVAVDGPSGAGKSSVCREVARRIGFSLLDTGAIYRCVALRGMEEMTAEPTKLAEIASDLPIRFESTAAGQLVFLGDRDVTHAIRSYEITGRVNSVSPVPEVRRALLDLQRRIGRRGNCIVEGRDIGSVVFPDAELKVFYTASVEARANRRMKEFERKGEKIAFELVAEQIRLRDETENNRSESPLIIAENAVILDTSDLDFEQSCCALADLIAERMKDI